MAAATLQVGITTYTLPECALTATDTRDTSGHVYVRIIYFASAFYCIRGNVALLLPAIYQCRCAERRAALLAVG
jgi:hypothetical protein